MADFEADRGKSRLYYDVTQLVHWQGRITGIPRVIDELANRFAKDAKREITFVSWVKDVGSFCEVDFIYTMSHRDEGIAYVKPGESTTVATNNSTATASAEAPLINPDLTRQAKRYAKAGLRRVAIVSPRLAEKVGNKLRQTQAHDYKQLVVDEHTVLFVPWGEWWVNSFTDYLVECHRQGARLIQVIHDVAPTTQPQFFEQKEEVSPTIYNSRIIPLCSLVLAVSENSKRELTDWLKQQKLHVPPIEVFRLGDSLEVSKPVKPAEQRFSESGLKGQDFMLTVGTIEAKKNHYLLYYVYKLAKIRGIELPKIAIVGRLGWHTQQMYDIMTGDPEVRDSFVFLHNISDEELAWLYDKCLFTVLPSWHEGWGIPIAESLRRGVPCLCSNTSSMVEIAKGISIHFSPASAEECLAAIQNTLKPSVLAAERKKAATYRPHDWDASYKQATVALKENKL